MLGLEHDFRVVDVHVRLAADGLDADTGPEDTLKRRVGPDALEREMRQAGVVRSVVFPHTADAETRGYLSANNAVARCCVDRPFVPFARLCGARSPDSGPGARLRNLASARTAADTDPDDIERYAYGDRFEGFVLDPATDGLPDESVLGALDDVERPLLVRGGRSFPPAAVERHFLDRSFPVVLAHFGGHPLDHGLANEAIDLLGDYGRLYLDTSCVRRRSVLERALREHPDRVVFGSGAPSVHPNVAVMELLTLDVPEDAMRRAFERNAPRLVPALGSADRDGP